MLVDAIKMASGIDVLAYFLLIPFLAKVRCRKYDWID